jgi:hypothetical protein
MTINLSQVGNTQSFGTWLQRTNDLVVAMGANVVTVDTTVGGSVSTGNAFVNGIFGSNTLYVTNIVAGNISVNGASVTISSNLNVTGVTAVFGNSSSNVQLGYLATPSSIQESYGNQNNYIQIVLQNANSGHSASADYAVYNDQGINSNVFTDIGINSSLWSNTTWTINGPNDGYIYSGNNNFSVGTAGQAYINFFANGTLANNEIMRIDSGANVGIGNTNPNARLQVTGTANVDGVFNVGGAATLANTIAVTGNATFSNQTIHTGNVSFSNQITVTGNATFNNTVLIVGATVYSNTINVVGAANLQSSANVGGTLGVVGAATLSSTLVVNGAVTIANTLAVTNAATFSNTISVTGAATLSNTIAVTGAATLSNTIAVTGAATLSNTLIVTGSANLQSTLGVQGAANLFSTLGLTGAATLSNTISVTGAAILSNTLAVTNSATFGNTVTISGLTTVNSVSIGNAATVTGIATFNSNAAFNGSVTAANIALGSYGTTNGVYVNTTIISIGNSTSNTTILNGNVYADSITTYNLNVTGTIIGGFSAVGSIIPSPNNSLVIGNASNTFANAYIVNLYSSFVSTTNVTATQANITNIDVSGLITGQLNANVNIIAAGTNSSISIGTSSNTFNSVYVTNVYTNAITSQSGSLILNANTVVDGSLSLNTNTSTNTAFLIANTYQFTNTTAQITDSFPVATYRTAEYTIQVVDNTSPSFGYQMSKLLLVQDGTNAYITEYGQIYSNTALGAVATFTANISAGVVRLYGTATVGSASTSNVVAKILRTTFTV